MRSRSLALSVTALALLLPLSACGGGDDKKDDDGASSGGSSGEVSSGTGKVAGPDKPATNPPSCPFSEKQLDSALGVKLKTVKKQDCAFEARKGQGRISVTRDTSADNKSYAKEATSYGKWDNFQELDDVDGQAYVAWSDNELNIAIGYLDNAGAYRYQVSALTPDEAGAEDAPDLAEQLIDLTVDSRKD